MSRSAMSRTALRLRSPDVPVASQQDPVVGHRLLLPVLLPVTLVRYCPLLLPAPLHSLSY